MDSIWYTIPGMIILTVCMLALSVKLLHYFQLESYQFRGYFKTLRRQWKKTYLPFTVAGIMISVFPLILHDPESYMSGSNVSYLKYNIIVTALVCFPSGVFAFIYHWIQKKKKEKKPLVYTARMKRLFGIYAAVLMLLQIILFYLTGYALGVYGLIIAFLPFVFALSALVALPVEKTIFRMYFEDARKKLLKNDNLIRIGITGSYGKTSTKFVLAEILSQKYNVLYTPASFNTPMGVTRIIRERLEPSHQVFIGEMGARHVGEIKELSRLIMPSIGILTSVGPQHLDTFKTQERIKNTKYELIEALPDDGFAVFSDDGSIVRGLYEKTTKPKAIVGSRGSDAWAENITVSSSGSSFDLCLKGKPPVRCTTKLLGEHNIRNIVVASCVADKLGLTANQIARGVSRIEPVEHRLQLLKTVGGITVIDDAFNTNPRSAKEALKVLGSFEGRRILVTPGMVELGKDEEKYNYEFGKNICGHADMVFLIGKKHTAPIRRGMTEGGFDASNIFTCQSLNEAVAQMNGLTRSGDVVMYENDLPDHYSEN